MSKEKNAAQADPESDFISVLIDDQIDGKKLTDAIEKSREMISKVSNIPTNTIILNFEIFTRHPNGSTLRDREAQPFYDALLYVFRFIYMLFNALQHGDNIGQYSDQVRRALHDEWNNCSRCPHLQPLMMAAFGLVSEDPEMLDRSFQPKYLAFLADTVLLQSLLCQSRFLQHILTAVGKIFVLVPVEKYPFRIDAFRDNERKSSTSLNNLNNLDNLDNLNNLNNLVEGNTNLTSVHSDFQVFLRLVGNISQLRKGNDDFAYMFHQVGNNFIHYATDFVSKSLFATFIDTLAALTKSRTIALEFHKRLKDSLSDVVNLKHVVEAFNGYASDFQNSEISHHKLDYHDANSLEAILRLFKAFFKYSEEIRNEIANEENKDEEKNWNFVDSLINLIHSPVPASLKAACFDVLAALTVDEKRTRELWGKLEKCQILTKKFIDEGKGGIISDIDNIEADARSYPLARSFAGFLSSLLASLPPLQDFLIYHRFLFEQCLLKLRTRVFVHFHEKWSLLAKVCQCWTNLVIHTNCESVKYLLQTALCDTRFIRELIVLVNEEDSPQEALLCVFRLLLLIHQKTLRNSSSEPSFVETMDPADHVFYTPITKSFSWSSEAMVKLIQCVSSNDRDLQLVSLNFAAHLAKDSDEISQVVFSRVQAKAISSFKKVIDVDEEENDEERNMRNTLLEFLISLGSTSYFVRYVCNFNLMDPPQSLLHSTLENGILPEILRKMKETEAAKNFPVFAANSLKLLLMICDNSLTSRPLLNLLRSSHHSFFDAQLRLLQDVKASLTAIGCFLQLLAREATDSMNDSYSGTTLQTFRILMGTGGFREQNRKRIVLFDDFIDRINDSHEAVVVARGIFEATVAFGSSTSAIKAMRDNQGHWINVWVQFLVHIFQKVENLTFTESVNFLTQSVGFIGMFLFMKKVLGEVPYEERTKVFPAACRALYILNSNSYSRTVKLGIYSLISCIKISDLKDKFVPVESSFIASLADDLQAETPVMRAAVYATAEAIISIAEVDIMQYKFVQQAIDCLRYSNNDDSDYFIEHKGAAPMLAAQYSFFNRLLITKPEEYVMVLVDNCLIDRISKESFWNVVRESYATSAQSQISETTLQVASKALHVITALCIFASENEKVRNESSEFYERNYKEQFLPIFKFPEFLTLNALRFLFDLCSFLIFAPGLAERSEIKEALEGLKTQFFDNSDKIKDRIREPGEKIDSQPAPEVLREADKIIEQFEKFLQ